MRTKVIVDGLNNSQKLRVILNGVHVYTTVKGMAFDTFGQTEQRVAVWDAVMRLAIDRRIAKIGEGVPTGLSGEFRGHQVQVDLV